MEKGEIRVYDTERFTDTFMPSEELRALFQAGYGKFLIVPVEDMYRHVSKSVPASRATNHTCIYLTEGEAYMKIGSELHIIHRDEMLFVPAGQVFSFEAYDHTKFNKGFLCHFSNNIFSGKFGQRELYREFEFLSLWGNPTISLGEEISAFVLHIFKRLLIEYAGNGLEDMQIIQSYLITLLCEVKAVYKPLSDSSRAAALSITHRFKELVFANIRTIHLVTGYAALLNVTPNHLNKTIKAITAKSPTKWIDEAIVTEAKILLVQSDLSIGEVSAAVGLEDPSYFSRLFRRYEGITPNKAL